MLFLCDNEWVRSLTFFGLLSKNRFERDIESNLKESVLVFADEIEKPYQHFYNNNLYLDPNIN